MTRVATPLEHYMQTGDTEVPETVSPETEETLPGTARKGPKRMTHDNAISLIKEYEGYRGPVYEDTGKHARGWGFTTDRKGKALTADSGDITEEEAEIQLTEHVEDLQNTITKKAEKDGVTGLNENQVAALSSLAFNIGPDRLFKSEGWKALKRGDTETAMLELFDEDKGFVKAGNKKLAGLVRRRAAERDLFSSV